MYGVGGMGMGEKLGGSETFADEKRGAAILVNQIWPPVAA